ncbi:MAG TPA: zf-TFIIB domain-containing protein [Planctomycetota bacterium]|nr:zf-TFIIB domain-containing protein [Planctomycetota bacterium]
MCPACKEPLIVFELDGVEIDRCLRCGGTWLDAGEIDQLARLGGGAKDPLETALATASNPKPGERRCVRCSGKMQVVTVQSVEIDRCPRGHGNWFDRDEIETLVAAHKDGGVAQFLGQLQPAQPKKGG